VLAYLFYELNPPLSLTHTQVIAQAFSRVSSSGKLSRTPSGAADASEVDSTDKFTRTPSGRSVILERRPSGGAAEFLYRLPSTHGVLDDANWAAFEEEEEANPDVGDIFFDADMHRPKRSYPTTVTPYVGPPYAHEVCSGLS
jgi:hypothetical protein